MYRIRIYRNPTQKDVDKVTEKVRRTRSENKLYRNIYIYISKRKPEQITYTQSCIAREINGLRISGENDREREREHRGEELISIFSECI